MFITEMRRKKVVESMRQIKVVLIGGGTGLSVLARGLKTFPVDITTIVTVADDGGSTGKIRSEMDIPAPGDIRNVIAALSEVEPTLEQLFQYRFDENHISGHSLGNLIIAAMTNLTNDFGHAVKELSKILNIKGRVIPSTNVSVALNAEMEDGEIVRGESNIPKKNKRIKRVFLEPEDVQPMDEAIEALEDADLIVLGPGSLYTSVICNLCVSGIADTLRRTKAAKLYVANVMTQSGETDGYSAYDHVAAIHDHAGGPFLDYVICSTALYDPDVLARYEREGAVPVYCDTEKLRDEGVRVITDPNLVEISDHHYVRHNNEVIANLIYEVALAETKTIEFQRKSKH